MEQDQKFARLAGLDLGKLSWLATVGARFGLVLADACGSCPGLARIGLWGPASWGARSQRLMIKFHFFLLAALK